MESLNQKVGCRGSTWQELLKCGLPQWLREQLATCKGGVPTEDDELVQAIKEISLAREQFLKEEKLRGHSVGEKDSVAKGKGGKRKRGAGKADDAREEKAPVSKKPKTSTASSAGKGTPRFTKEQKDEALRGILSNLVDAWMKKELGARCGLSNHRWQWCRKEISISSTHKMGKKEKKDQEPEKKEESASASSVSRKRKAPAHTVCVGITQLPVEERILANLRVKGWLFEESSNV